MKKSILRLVLFLFISNVAAQSEEKYIISAGTNFISNVNAERNQLAIKNLEFNNPFFFGVERKISRMLSVEAIILTNRVTGVENVNGISRSKDYGYFGIDLNGKFYFEDLFTKRYQNRWDIYLDGGAGLYNLNNFTAYTLNFGGGLQFWFDNSFGIGVKAMGKFGLEPINEMVNNYYQFNLGLLFRI